MSKPQAPSLTLKRRLKAPAETVFSAWTDPEKIVHWFGPAETASDSVRADMDVRVGGRFNTSFDVEGNVMENHGVYLEVVPGERLVFTDGYTEGWKPAPEAGKVPALLGILHWRKTWAMGS